MELIAHRAGNMPELIAPALTAADGIELDVHQFRHRLEVRHSKVVWPLALYWERREGLLRDQHPPALDAILAATPEGSHLWVDLKGTTPWFVRRVVGHIGDRRPLTMSCRSWWALRPARREPGIRTFRSVGNRCQLWLALRLRHPDGVAIHERFALPEHVDRLRGRCRTIAVWGVADRDRAGEVDDLGVSALIIDDLELIRSLQPPR